MISITQNKRDFNTTSEVKDPPRVDDVDFNSSKNFDNTRSLQAELYDVERRESPLSVDVFSEENIDYDINPVKLGYKVEKFEFIDGQFVFVDHYHKRGIMLPARAAPIQCAYARFLAGMHKLELGVDDEVITATDLLARTHDKCDHWCSTSPTDFWGGVLHEKKDEVYGPLFYKFINHKRDAFCWSDEVHLRDLDLQAGRDEEKEPDPKEVGENITDALTWYYRVKPILDFFRIKKSRVVASGPSVDVDGCVPTVAPNEEESSKAKYSSMIINFIKSIPESVRNLMSAVFNYIAGHTKEFISVAVVSLASIYVALRCGTEVKRLFLEFIPRIWGLIKGVFGRGEEKLISDNLDKWCAKEREGLERADYNSYDIAMEAEEASDQTETMQPLVALIGSFLGKIPFDAAFRIARKVTPIIAVGTLSINWIVKCLPVTMRLYIYEFTGFTCKGDLLPNTVTLLSRVRNISESFVRDKAAVVGSHAFRTSARNAWQDVITALFGGVSNRSLDHKAIVIARDLLKPIMQAIEECGGASSVGRMCPVGVYIYGKSQIGKSVVSNFLPAMLAGTDAESCSYTYAPGSKHFDGYTQQYSFNVDDWSAISAEAKAEINMFLMTAISNKIYSVPKASLQNKGMGFESKMVLMTSNEPMKVVAGIDADYAFKKRFRHFRCELVPGYENDSGSLDVNKLKKLPNSQVVQMPHLRFVEMVYTGIPGEKEYKRGSTFSFSELCATVGNDVATAVAGQKMMTNTMRAALNSAEFDIPCSGIEYKFDGDRVSFEAYNTQIVDRIISALEKSLSTAKVQSMLAKYEWVGCEISQRNRDFLVETIPSLNEYYVRHPMLVRELVRCVLKDYYFAIYRCSRHDHFVNQYLACPNEANALKLFAENIVFVADGSPVVPPSSFYTENQHRSIELALEDKNSSLSIVAKKQVRVSLGPIEARAVFEQPESSLWQRIRFRAVDAIIYSKQEIVKWIREWVSKPYVRYLAGVSSVVACLGTALVAADYFGFVAPNEPYSLEGNHTYSRTQLRAARRVREKIPKDPVTVDSEIVGTTLYDNFPLDQIRKAVTRFTVGSMRLHGVFIGGTIVLIPVHFFLRSFDTEPHFIPEGTVFSYETEEGVKNVKFQLKDLRYNIISNAIGELCAYDLGLHVNRKRDIRKHLLTEEQLANIGSKCVYISPNQLDTHDLVYNPRFAVHGEGVLANRQMTNGHLRYNRRTARGQCGQLIATNMNGVTRICGMHYGGNTSNLGRGYGFALPITRERVNSLLTDFGLRESAITTALVATDATPPKVTKARSVGFLREPFSGLADTGDMRKSIFFDCEQLKDVKYYPSILSARDPRAEGLTQIGLVDNDWQRLRNTLDFDQEIVDAAAQHLSEKIRMLIPRCPKRLLDWHEVIYGTETFCYLNKLNMKSTAGAMPGFGSVGPKRNLFDIDDVPNALYEPSEAIREEVKTLIERYSKREDHPVIWSMFLKSELRNKKKIEAKLTRTVMASPLSFTIVCRMYFGSFMNAFHGMPIDVGFSAIGMNPYSFDWELMIGNLLRFGEYGFDGDFKKFEGVLTTQLMAAIETIIDDYYGNRCLVRRACLHAMLHSFFRIGDALYKKEYMNPSGNAMTTVFNILVNALLMRVVFIIVAKEQGISLHDAMALYTKSVGECYLGDDQIMSVSDPVIKWFNSYEVSRVLEEYGNITYTAADKSAVDSYIEKRVIDCEFLKGRTVSRVSKTGQRYFCWADEESIMKSLTHVKKGIDPLLAAYTNANDALYRLVPSGPARYNALRDWTGAKLAEEGCVTPLYTYEYMESRMCDFGDLVEDIAIDTTLPNRPFAPHEATFAQAIQVQGGIATKITNYNIEQVANSNIDFSGQKDVLDQEADAKVDAKYGLDRPNVNLHDHMVRKYVGDMATACNIERANNMDLYGNSVGESLKSRGDTATDVDENALSYLLTKPSLLFQGSVSVNMGPNTTVWSTLLSPNVNVMRATTSNEGGENFQPSLLGFVTVPYAFWRGSLKYKFQFITSKVHTLRVAVLTHYGTTSEAITLGEAFGQYGSVFDVTAEQTEFEVEVPWRFDRPWARISHGSMGSEYIMGELSLRIINPLVANNTVSEDIAFNVFISGGEDFEVNFQGVGVYDFAPEQPLALDADNGSGDLGTSGVYFEETKVDTQPDNNRSVMPETNLDTINESEMTFTRIVERAQIMATLDWNTTLAPGTVLRSFDVPLSSVTSRTTASPWNRFLYYNLPVVRFRIDLQSTLFQAGMLAVTFVPLVAESSAYEPTLTDVSVLPHVMIKAGSNVSTTFDVPWLHQFSALRKDSDISLGRMYILAFNALNVSSDATELMSLARIVVYASFPGADFKVVDADDENEVPINPVEIQGDGGVVDEPEASGEADAPVSTTVLAPEGEAASRSTHVNATPYATIRDGFKRYLLDSAVSPATSESVIYPYDNIVRSHEFINYFANAFRFYTGTVRIKVMGYASRLTYVPEDIIGADLPVVGNSLTRLGAAPIAVSNSGIGLLEAQLPFQTNLKFLKNRTYTPLNTRFLEYSAGRYCLDNVGEGAISEPLSETYLAGGDDFRMFYLYRVPRLTVRTEQLALFAHNGRPITLPATIQIQSFPDNPPLPLTEAAIYKGGGRYSAGGTFTVTTADLSDADVLAILGVNRENFSPITYSGGTLFSYTYNALPLEEIVYVTPSNNPGGVFHGWDTVNESILFNIAAANNSNIVNNIPGELDTQFSSIMQFGGLNANDSHNVVISGLPQAQIENFFEGIAENHTEDEIFIVETGKAASEHRRVPSSNILTTGPATGYWNLGGNLVILDDGSP